MTRDPNTAIVVGTKNKFANLAQLSMWGIVFVEASSVGFAMEFIGDMADSTIGGNIGFMVPTTDLQQLGTAFHGDALPGRGVN